MSPKRNWPKLLTSDIVLLGNRVRPGADAMATFQLRNGSGEDVSIRHVKVSCGCVSYHLDRQDLPSGEAARLDVRLKMPLQGGGQIEQTAVAELQSGGQTFHLPLRIAATLVEDRRSCSVFPRVLDLGHVSPGRSVEGVFYVVGDRAMVDALPDVVSGRFGDRTEWRGEYARPAGVRGAKQIHVNVTAPPEWSEAGSGDAIIDMCLNGLEPQRMTVRARHK